MVDYPIKIPPGSEELRAGRTSAGRRIGPFFRGATIYAFLLDIVTKWTDAHIEVWKSDDQGETWLQLNAINDPDVEGASLGTYFAARGHFDLAVVPKIYVLYNATDGKLRVKPFNTTKDRWESASAAGPARPSAESSLTFQMERRPTGINGIEFPIIYAGAKDNIGGTDYQRVYYTIYRSLTDTWDAPVRLFGGAAEAEHYSAKSSAAGPTSGVGQGRVHFFARKGLSDLSVGQDTVHKSIESNDTINSQETVATVGEPKVGRAKGGSEIVLPFKASGDNLHVARAISSASMSWSIEDVLLDDTGLSDADEYATDVVAAEGGSLRAYFTVANGTNTEDNLYYSDDAGSGSWGEKQLVHTIEDALFAEFDTVNVAVSGSAIGNLTNLFVGSFSSGPAHYTQDGVLTPAVELNNGIFEAPGGYVIA